MNCPACGNTYAEDERFCPDCKLPLVLGDSDQLSIVFGNLIRNAREAMPEGGRVRVHATVRGPSALIQVEDEGGGISPQVRDRLFEPFYDSGTMFPTRST